MMTASDSSKKSVTFSPLPARTIGDQRLTAIHFRALLAICLHDRMSGPLGKGQGCWASHKTLATKCGCNYTNLSTAIGQLAEWGYVERSPHPMNKRQRVYRVIYTDDDNAIAITPKSLPEGKQFSPKAGTLVCPDTDIDSTVVCPDSEEAVQYQCVGEVEYIPRSEEEIMGTMEKDAVETAPLGSSADLDFSSATEVGTFLRKAEARMKANELSAQELSNLWDSFNEIEAHLDQADPLHQWARRLLEQLG